MGILHKECTKYNNSNTTWQASEKDLQIKCFNSMLGQRMSRNNNQIKLWAAMKNYILPPQDWPLNKCSCSRYLVICHGLCNAPTVTTKDKKQINNYNSTAKGECDKEVHKFIIVLLLLSKTNDKAFCPGRGSLALKKGSPHVPKPKWKLHLKLWWNLRLPSWPTLPFSGKLIAALHLYSFTQYLTTLF